MSVKDDRTFFPLWIGVVLVLLIWSGLYTFLAESLIDKVDIGLYQFKLGNLFSLDYEVKLLYFMSFFLFSMGVVMPILSFIHRKKGFDELLLRLSINGMLFLISTVLIAPLLQVGFGVELVFIDMVEVVKNEVSHLLV